MRKMLLGVLLAAPALACTSAFAQSPGERSAVFDTSCNYQCLTTFVKGYMDALARRDLRQLKLAPGVRFTENNVEMPLGNGLWGTITGVAATALIAADTQTGETAWIGTVEENGIPAYYGMRLQVRSNAISEVETIVVRNVGLPLPFGDVKKIVHDPAFNEILPPEQRRSRERLRAVADSYFNTVELNDGVVFAPFDQECGRLENGILTTAAQPGAQTSAANIAAGCENQFKLGLYRINKRIRERRYFLIDVERGVVVSTGFFDHANEFDRYKTTDGVERRTALKWPNSISLVEAFKVRNGAIYRIEAIFTYVPYFMHSPFYKYPPPPPVVAAAKERAQACDRACLLGLVDRYMDAMVRREPSALPWADTVRFTENSVSQQIGEGIWGSIRAKSDTALRVADPATGNVAWLGMISDHDLPAYFGLRMRVVNGRIADVETVVARKGNPGPFGDAAAFRIDASLAQPLAARERLGRHKLAALVDDYADSIQAKDGRVQAPLAATCERSENGQSVTQGNGGAAVIVKNAATLAQGCAAQIELGLYEPVERVRDRRTPVIDDELGIVVATSFTDFPLREPRYTLRDGRTVDTQDKAPSSREMFEVFKVRGGRIERIDAVSVFQPYRMPSPWVP